MSAALLHGDSNSGRTKPATNGVNEPLIFVAGDLPGDMQDGKWAGFSLPKLGSFRLGLGFRVQCLGV